MSNAETMGKFGGSDKEVILTFNRDDFGVIDQTGSGQVEDVVAVAVGYYEFHDAEVDNFDYIFTGLIEEAKSYVRDEINYINYLNEKGESDVDPTSDYYAGITSWMDAETDLKFGAWLYLEKRPSFDELYDDWKERIYEQVNDVAIDPADGEDFPSDLAESLNKSMNFYRKEMHREFLYGDRSDSGVLGHLQRMLRDYASDVDITDEGDLAVTINMKDAIEYAENEHWYDEEFPNLIEYIRDDVISSLEYSFKREKQRRFERTQKHQEQQARIREVQQRREAAKLAKIEAMKKED